MRVIYSYKEGMMPQYVSNTNGSMRVLLVLEDLGDYIVYFCDDYHRQSFINRIINKLSGDIYNLTNFEKVVSDEQFNFIDNWIRQNYNYNAIHVGEKVDGEDQGGPVIWLPESERKKDVQG